MAKKRQALKNVTKASWLFGHPVLRADNNSKANWSATTSSPYFQKGGGWFAELYGGVQTNDDWAAVYIPVNEMPVKEFQEAQWSYYMTTSDSFGVNIVIWLHDAEDFDNRVEVTQMGSVSGLDKSAGWNAHEFNPATTQMFYYGELTTAASNKTDLTEGTQYTWAQFQADALFKDWLIYRISIEFGWQASGTFGTAYVAEIKLNEVPIPLVPRSSSHMKTVSIAKTMIADSKAANDVVSENATTGTDWDFNFGGIGYITKAVIIHDATLTDRLRLYLFSQPPTSETDDNVANTSPLTVDQGFFLGTIDFPAFGSQGTGDAFTVATPSTTGNLPLTFDSSVIYGILVTRDGITTVAEALTINLTADMEDS